MNWTESVLWKARLMDPIKPVKENNQLMPRAKVPLCPINEFILALTLIKAFAKLTLHSSKGEQKGNLIDWPLKLLL